ncbi:uncharacterized protein KGF55_002592 [Candida pseudojiufengensis]|uniref:uncharacterized protein n=1 Tax=Candida pseudojiufengensis TaxID=497109 RepID=UPI002224BF9B|nr:uncharacterized protein KGF55_002592 [Candida pseudojiufengensis]KAI5963712.1 hypothetical protein KGF55_002592 [Candida pseudojiufengensis]
MVLHLPSTNSIIFNQNILKPNTQPQFIELSYSELNSKEIEEDTTINLVSQWYPIGDCVTNYAGDKATYRQTWSVEFDFGVDYRLNYGGYFINFGPGYKSNFIWAKGFGGSFGCDLDPGNTLQFAILFTKYEVDGVKYREIKRGSFWNKNRIKFGEWKRFNRFETIDKNDIQIACFTDPRNLRCK